MHTKLSLAHVLQTEEQTKVREVASNIEYKRVRALSSWIEHPIAKALKVVLEFGYTNLIEGNIAHLTEHEMRGCLAVIHQVAYASGKKPWSMFAGELSDMLIQYSTARTQFILDRYSRARNRLAKINQTVGASRLSLRSIDVLDDRIIYYDLYEYPGIPFTDADRVRLRSAKKPLLDRVLEMFRPYPNRRFTRQVEGTSEISEIDSVQFMSLFDMAVAIDFRYESFYFKPSEDSDSQPLVNTTQTEADTWVYHSGEFRFFLRLDLDAEGQPDSFVTVGICAQHEITGGQRNE